MKKKNTLLKHGFELDMGCSEWELWTTYIFPSDTMWAIKQEFIEILRMNFWKRFVKHIESA